MNDPFKRFRKSLRAWRKQRRLEKEGQSYKEFFLKRRLSVPGDDEIRALSKSRFPGLVPRQKGSLNIIAIYHNYNWEGPSLGPSLAAFGTVCTLDWKDPALSGGLLNEDRGWKKRVNEGLIDAASKSAAARPFDAVFTYLAGGHVTKETVLKLRELGGPVVNLSLNDKESFIGKLNGKAATGMRDICSGFDLCWTSTEDALEKYVVEGATPIYLPEGANPLLHRPYDDEKKVYDVSFVGQCYGNRPATVDMLRKAGIKVEVFGPGWPNGPLSTEEMVRTWSRSRINLGFGGVQGHKETFCLKGRDFEVPMSGGLYLTEHHDELLPFYDVGREIVTYKDQQELVDKIRWLLSNPEKADAIRRAGRERALCEHTWEMRFEKVFRLLGVLA